MITLRSCESLLSAAYFAICQQIAVFVGICALTIPIQASAQNGDYDEDCAVIVCLAGGFPAGCYATYDYMLNRLRDGNSPFGACTGSHGKDYKRINVPYSRLSRYSRLGWYCPKTTQLHHEVKEDDHGRRHLTAFCYTDKIIGKAGGDEGSQNHVFYRGKRPANRVNFRVQITVEPGTAQEYRSPTYLLNYDTGFFMEQGK